MSLPHRRFAIAAAAAALALLAGCTAASPSSTPGSTVPQLPDPVTLSGSGPQTTTLTVPEGAQALRVHLACTSGDFHISSANTDLVDDRHGYCGGMTTVVVPVAKGPSMEFTVTVDDAESLVAELQFSTQPPRVDAAVAEDCQALGVFYSLTLNADTGFELGLVDSAAWQDAVDEAKATLEEMTPTPMLELQVTVLRDWISSVTEPGSPNAGRSPDVAAADNLSSQVCTDNGSTIRILGQYGG